jgi:hypothetical protein
MEEGAGVKRMFLVVGIAASLALSACGSSPAARKAALKEYVASLGSSPNLQVKLTGNFTGAGSTTPKKVLKVLSFGMNFSSTTGSAISQSGGNVNLELTADVSGTPFLDLVKAGNNIYLKIDASALGTIPGVKISASELALVQATFGGRWYELPKSLLNSVIPKKDAVGANATESKVEEAKVVDAITNLIDTTPYTSTSNGYSETGTLLSLTKAIYGAVSSLSHGTGPTATKDKGTYTLSVSTSGSGATGASFSVTTPNGTKGNATGALTATFAHASTSVSAPSGATVITAALLRDFGLGAKP